MLYLIEEHRLGLVTFFTEIRPNFYVFRVKIQLRISVYKHSPMEYSVQLVNVFINKIYDSVIITSIALIESVIDNDQHFTGLVLPRLTDSFRKNNEKEERK